MTTSKVVPKDQAGEGDLYFDEDNQLHGKGIIRTEEICTSCDKMFIMKVDFAINGNHVLVCPHCGHQHFRVIEDGIVTGDRWDSSMEHVEVSDDSTWSDTTINAKSTAVFQHIRERWLR